MEWVLQSPQLHSIFSNLGFTRGDGYHINKTCNAGLETILTNILSEDKCLLTFRRNISFGQNVQKDLIPLLIHAKDDTTIELLIEILINVAIPVECLMLVDDISKTDFGRHTIFEINNLLKSTKVAFTDQRVTKVIIEHLKKNLILADQSKLCAEQCNNINNCLLLLRNILHIPEDIVSSSPGINGRAVQNQILWNLFSQSIDKILIKLMNIPEASCWSVTMVQLLALLYKDQHVSNLHKHLNMWLEVALSETSDDDNESNTTPPFTGEDNSSSMSPTDSTSESSDSEMYDKMNFEENPWSYSANSGMNLSASVNNNKYSKEWENNCLSDNMVELSVVKLPHNIKNKKTTQVSVSGEKIMNLKSSDGGYDTHLDSHGMSTSSSDNKESPMKKMKLYDSSSLVINKSIGAVITLQEKKRKKIVKRGQADIINVHGLSHKTPTDDDISNILKEFTVDFLLKGYNSLVKTLHCQILTNSPLEMDKSHYFWLLTYFLKFATQIELNLEHISSIISFEIVSYLTAEGVNLCEEIELSLKTYSIDLKPCLRSLHLVVTAIREFIQAIEVYKTSGHISDDNLDILDKLELKMCESVELRSLMVLLLRHYNPDYHSKQYLQDLIVTNHILLTFMDNIMKLTNYDNPTNMVEHMKQFTSTKIMSHYGLLLEDYLKNGEFVNDCIFTVMHHVGGELDSLTSLNQPHIINVFNSIREDEIHLCDDWRDLIDYVINTFTKKPQTLPSACKYFIEMENLSENKNTIITLPEEVIIKKDVEIMNATSKSNNIASSSSEQRWTEDEISSLNWYYMRSNSTLDVIGDIHKLFAEDGVHKERKSIITELLMQNIISTSEYNCLLENESVKEDVFNNKNTLNEEVCHDGIAKQREQLIKDGKLIFLHWVQKNVLDVCFAKIFLAMKSTCMDGTLDSTVIGFELLNTVDDQTAISLLSYHFLRLHLPIPLVPWNCEQASICKDLSFVQFLDSLGFFVPVDSGKVYIRIPNTWTAEDLYNVARRIAPLPINTLKFHVVDINDTEKINVSFKKNFTKPPTNVMDKVMALPQVNFNKSLRLGNPLAYSVRSLSRSPYTFKTCSSINVDKNEPATQNWLELVHKSRANKLDFYTERCDLIPCDTASVASDITQMGVSDE